MNMFKALVCSLIFSLGAITANAHHSVYGNFDVGTLVEVYGVFDSADIINPHAWFHFKQVDENGQPVLDENGQQVTWSFETPGPAVLRRMGVTENLFRQYGDQVFKIYTSPQLDGDTRGLFDLSVFPDGNVLIMGSRSDARFRPLLEKYEQ